MCVIILVWVLFFRCILVFSVKKPLKRTRTDCTILPIFFLPKLFKMILLGGLLVSKLSKRFLELCLIP